MKQNYIKLTQTGGADIYINHYLIVSMSPDKDKTFISTMGNKSFIVTESIDQIIKLINKADTFTFTTK